MDCEQNVSDILSGKHPYHELSKVLFFSITLEVMTYHYFIINTDYVTSNHTDTSLLFHNI